MLGELLQFSLCNWAERDSENAESCVNSTGVHVSSSSSLTASFSKVTAVKQKLAVQRVLASNWLCCAAIGMSSESKHAHQDQSDHLLLEVNDSRVDRDSLPACPREVPSEFSLECIWTEVV